jgi:multiple sugar transport system substrate-binding protein
MSAQRETTMKRTLVLGSVLAAFAGACSSSDQPVPPDAARDSGPDSRADTAVDASAPDAAIADAPADALGVASDGSTAQIALKVSWWGSPDRDSRTTRAIQMFEAKHPDVKVSVEHYANTQGTGKVGTDYWPTMNAHAADGTLPDVMQQDYAYIGEWTGRGLLASLDDRAKDGSLDLSDVSGAVIDGGRVNGHIMGVSLGTNTQTIVLDTNAFADANIPIPGDDWTWADFERIALELKAKLGIFGFGVALHGYTAGWKAVTLSKGQWVWSADGKALGYSDDSPWIEHWKMILRLQAAGALPRLDQEPGTSSIEAAPLAFGKSAMEFAHSNQIVALWSAAGTARTLKALPVPRVAGGRSPVYLKPSQYFSVTAGSKHSQQAAELISFFTNDLEANVVLGGERGVPIAAKVLTALKPALSKVARESFEIVERAGAYATQLPPNDPPAWTAILTQVFTPKVENTVMNLVWTPEVAVAEFRREASELLLGHPVPDGGPPLPMDGGIGAGGGDAASDGATDAATDAATNGATDASDGGQPDLAADARD